jgi:hypothetical protein
MPLDFLNIYFPAEGQRTTIKLSVCCLNWYLERRARPATFYPEGEVSSKNAHTFSSLPRFRALA